MYSYVARQPIFDRKKRLNGYELLFRDSLRNVFPGINPHEATSKLLAGSHLNLGLDDITGKHPAYINFPELTLLVRVPQVLPKEQVVVELLEEIQPSPKVVKICRKLKELGYRIALDDFVYKPHWHQILPYVDMIKVDVKASSTKELLAIQKLKFEYDLVLLAEKVETYEQFRKTLKMGFDLFQGFFFSRPEIIQRKNLNPSQINLIELLGKLGQPDCDFSELDTLIQRDVSITYKLLRFVNSSFFNQQVEISSIKQALTYIGENEFRKFVALLAAANLVESKAEELVKLSVTRAKFCELVTQKQNPEHSSEAFLMGLLSLISALLDQPIEAIMEKIPLAKPIKDAIVHQQGYLAGYLNLVLNYERAAWNNVSILSSKLGINQNDLPGFYTEAVGWSNALFGNVH